MLFSKAKYLMNIFLLPRQNFRLKLAKGLVPYANDNGILHRPYTGTPCNQVFSTKIGPDEKSSSKAKKKTPEQYVTLIGTDNNKTVTTLTEATKLSSRRGLKLIKVTNNEKHLQTPVYQLMTDAQYLKEDVDIKKQKKSQSGSKNEKIVSLTSRISSHDVQSKINQMKKWLDKKIECRVTISGSEPNDKLCEVVYEEMEKSLKDSGRFLQKRHSGLDLKFQVIPPKQKK